MTSAAKQVNRMQRRIRKQLTPRPLSGIGSSVPQYLTVVEMPLHDSGRVKLLLSRDGFRRFFGRAKLLPSRDGLCGLLGGRSSCCAATVFAGSDGASHCRNYARRLADSEFPSLSLFVTFVSDKISDYTSPDKPVAANLSRLRGHGLSAKRPELLSDEFHLLAGDIKVRAGPQNLWAGRGDENSIVTQAAGDLLGRSEAGIDCDEDKVRLDRSRFEAQPLGLFDLPRQDLGMAMNIGETFDVVVVRRVIAKDLPINLPATQQCEPTQGGGGRPACWSSLGIPPGSPGVSKPPLTQLHRKLTEFHPLSSFLRSPPIIMPIPNIQVSFHNSFVRHWIHRVRSRGRLCRLVKCHAVTPYFVMQYIDMSNCADYSSVMP